jgi:hypothetical protein
MRSLIKPKALQPSDMIVSILLSSGTAGMFPNRYQQGIQQME